MTRRLSVAGSSTGVARGMIGAGVAKGAPKPDISSEAAFRAALLNAKSIAVTDPASGGGSGVYFGKLFEQMGLAQSLKPKLKLAAGGTARCNGHSRQSWPIDFVCRPSLGP